jgi:hypothetical protein
VRQSLIAAVVAVAALAPATDGEAAARRRPTPALIERAVAQGRIDRATADRYLALALTDPASVPAAYRSLVPWEGTPVILELLDRGAWETAGPADTCGGFTQPQSVDTTHFHIHYADPTITGPLTIDDYVAALETSWQVEVDAFGWAPPPLVPGPRYLVVVEPLGPGVFGFVAPTSPPPGGDNPATSWNEGDASSSCMVLNANMDLIAPGGELAALQATVAHEFNHSIQFGYGALDGPAAPDPVFFEGGATWIEDEVFDGANDNYRYLWPDFVDDMGDYKDGSILEPYEYWITWRGMLEPFGTGNPGGGEDVMQRFWELTSQNAASNLEAMDAALRTKGSTLADAYHAHAVAVKFNRPCGGGYAPPHCLEEGPAYVAARGETPAHGSVSAIGQGLEGSVVDNYALNWVTLPSGIDYQVRLRNLSGGGRLRASIGCDTGAGLVVEPFSEAAGPGEVVWVRRFDATACQSTVAVITNVAQTEANPDDSAGRAYRLSVEPPPAPTRTTLRVRRDPDEIHAVGRLRPAHPGERMVVRLFERHGEKWRRTDTERPRLRKGRRYEATFDRPAAGRCRIEARFRGDLDHDPSRRRRTFAC